MVGKGRDLISKDGDSGSFGCWPMIWTLTLLPLFMMNTSSSACGLYADYVIGKDGQYNDDLWEESICLL